MYNFIVENEYGERLQLTGNPDYDILSITGLTPASANINMTPNATSDGAKHNSSKTNVRNIVITLSYRRDVERSRIALYRFFNTKKHVKMYYKNKHRDVYIEGEIETFEGDLYENGQRAQISILCPQPYFKANETIATVFSIVTQNLEFPVEFTSDGIEFSHVATYAEKKIDNPGDVETGMIIELVAREKVLEPTIYGLLDNEQFSIAVEMEKGDVIRINTIGGSKGITLIRDGIETNIINNVYRGSKWFLLREGINAFSYSCVFGAENLDITVYVTPLYGGV